MATIFGMTPTPIERCRVLELGCAAGGNLVPMAAYLPESQFLGIDLSSRQVAEGQETIAASGLTNVKLRTQSILDVTPEWGRFDYILCHGVWSWVPAEVRSKILSICCENLAPNGVAYVSYNCLPGWHMRGTIRDMMSFHAQKFETPRERVGHARALLDFLVRVVNVEQDPYGVLLKRELELLKDKADSYLLHEHLETVNHPVYFYQFAQQAGEQGLQYLAEADFGIMSASMFSEEAQKVLEDISRNLIEREQYLDFFRNRMFRQTLLCHSDVKLDRRRSPENIRGLRVRTELRPAPSDLPEGEYKFSSSRGTLTTRDIRLAAALEILAESPAEGLTVATLIQAVVSRLFSTGVFDSNHLAQCERELANQLLNGYSQKLVELSISPRASAAIPDRPLVNAYVRHQAQIGPTVTNAAHAMVQLTGMMRNVAQLADGQRDRDALAEALVQQAASGSLVVNLDGRRVTDPEQLRPMMADALQKSLSQLASEQLTMK
jgi:methyltransferase-like protein/SAM-dependent methyltransferase